MTEVIRGTPRPSLLPRNLVGLKVVVVDDDESSLDYFAVALGTCGAEVMTASTAAEALRLVQAGCPDVVLSDIAMVGRDGYWLVREIRGLADQAARLVPVVAFAFSSSSSFFAAVIPRRSRRSHISCSLNSRRWNVTSSRSGSK